MAADFSAILQEATFNDELMDLSMPRIPPPAALDGLVRPKAIDPRHSELTQDGVMPSPSPKLSKRKKSMKKQPRKKTIQLNERFSSFAEFETTFENWKNENYHPFRTASSETLREPDGSIDPIFKYRYIVFHCAHYGTPRVRASGTRKNKNSYLPCGCKAMLRVNYNFNDRELFIASLNAEHNGHELSFDDYERVMRRKTRTRIADTDVAVPSPPSMVLAAPMGGDFGGHYAVGGYGGHQLTPNFAQVMAPKSFAQVLEQHKAMMGLPTPDIPNDYEPQQDKMTSFAAKVEVDDPDYRMRVRSGSVHSDTPSFNSDDLTGQRSAAATPAAIGLQQAQQHTGNDPALAPVPMSLADNPQIQMLIGTLLGQLNGLDANAVQTRLSALTTLLSALPHAQ